MMLPLEPKRNRSSAKFCGRKGFRWILAICQHETFWRSDVTIPREDPSAVRQFMHGDPSENQRSIGFSGPISFIHQTRDGPVHLLVKASARGWESLHWGYRVAGTWTFD